MGDNKASSPDFVKKLFQMLGEHDYDHIVRWAPQGDSFLVLDTNEFTKTILPRHFKHSNFASFVRQLNKYDFHKVRQTDQALEGNPHGEGTWEFKHPEFNVHNGDSLDNIKRKAPAAKRMTKADETAQSMPSPILNGSGYYGRNEVQALQRQIDAMKAMQGNMSNHLQALTSNYQQVIGEMLNFQRSMVSQDQVMQNLISYLMSHANGTTKGSASGSNLGVDEHAQKLVDEYSEVARQSHEQIEGMTRRVSHLGVLPDVYQQQQHPQQHQAPSWPQYDAPQQQQPQGYSNFQHPFEPSANHMQSQQQGYMPYPQAPLQRGQSPGNYSGSSEAQTPGGSTYPSNQAYAPQQSHNKHAQSQIPHQQQPHPLDQQRRAEETQRHMQQQQQQQQQQQAQLMQHQIAAPQAQQPQSSMSRLQTPKDDRPDPMQQRQEYGDRFQGALPTSNNFEFSEQAASMIRAVKSGKKQITPWASPPKILLVEDDAVCRRLSSKFLTFFGCDIDTAFDGVSAVNLMNEKKYDLVLMDIVMPNLDGVSATSLIRQFDPNTPIISMTSNVESGDVLTYFSHGMNDVLPKPFTKDGLLGMLEKHLMHLKTLKQLGQSGQERDVISMNGFEVAKTDLGTVSEADYLGMLSGLSGNAIMAAPTSNSNVRRSIEDLIHPEHDYDGNKQGGVSKRAKLEEQ